MHAIWNTALDILQKRFASGERTKERYEEQKAIIERDSQMNIKG